MVIFSYLHSQNICYNIEKVSVGAGMSNIILSAFSDEYSANFVTQCKALNEFGIEYMEIRGVDNKNVSVLTKAEVAQVKQTLADYGIKVSAIGSPLGKIKLGGDMPAHLDTAKRVANYFQANVACTGYLPRIDFCQPPEPQYYDSTAGAIAACGLIELAKIVGGEEGETYLNTAIEMLKAMEKNWCDWTDAEDSILQMGSEMYGAGVHKPIIYGDYFFVEAMLKLKGNDFLPW